MIHRNKESEPPLPQNPLNQAETQSTIEREYHWEFPLRGSLLKRLTKQNFSISLSINRERYSDYHKHHRDTNAYRFHQYVTPNITEIETLANQLFDLGHQQGYSSYEHLCNVIAYVQQTIRYERDLSEGTGELIEHPKYPIETLVDKTGDCEDQAILAAAILKNLGYQTALLILPTHVALGVVFAGLNGVFIDDDTTGKRYIFIEMTKPGWLPGELPPEFEADVENGECFVLSIK